MLSQTITEQVGFTLMELMITITIGAILVGIAVPSYLGYVRESNRSEAITTIHDIMARQALYFANHGGSYATSVSLLGLMASLQSDTTLSEKEHYQIQMLACPGQCIELRAVAFSVNQKKDTDCQTFILNSRGRQVSEDANGSSSTECWP